MPLAAAIVSLVSPVRAAQGATIAAGVASLAVTGVAAYSVRDGSALGTAGQWLGLDALGAVFLLATGLLYAAAAVFSVGYLRPERGGEYRPFARRYFAYLNLFCWTLLARAARDRLRHALDRRRADDDRSRRSWSPSTAPTPRSRHRGSTC